MKKILIPLLLSLFLLPKVQAQNCTIYGTVYNTLRQPLANDLIVVHKVLVNGVLVNQTPQTLRTDGNGYFSFSVPKNSVVYVAANIPGYNKFNTGVPLAVTSADSMAMTTMLFVQVPVALPITIDSTQGLSIQTVRDLISDSLDADPRAPAVGSIIHDSLMASVFSGAMKIPWVKLDTVGSGIGRSNFSINTATGNITTSAFATSGTVTFTQGSDTIRGHGTRWMDPVPTYSMINQYYIIGPDSLYSIWDVLDDSTAILSGSFKAPPYDNEAFRWPRATTTIAYNMADGLAINDESLSLGVYSRAGDGGTALGAYSWAGQYGTALGRWATTDYSGTAVGLQSYARSNGVAIGMSTVAGDHGVVVGGTGYNQDASYGIAINTYAQLQGTGTIAIGGVNNLVSGYLSATIGGDGLVARARHETWLGYYNDSTTYAANTAGVLFGVGNGTYSARANAFTIDKYGTVRTKTVRADSLFGVLSLDTLTTLRIKPKTGDYIKMGRIERLNIYGTDTSSNTWNLNLGIGFNPFGYTSVSPGGGNVALGGNIMSDPDGSAYYNVAIGNYAMNKVAGASYNVAIGTWALRYNSNGGNNVAVGYNALGELPKNYGFITALGAEAGTHSFGDSSTYVGAFAGHNARGKSITLIGAGAMAVSSGTDSIRNSTALGVQSIVRAPYTISLGDTSAITKVVIGHTFPSSSALLEVAGNIKLVGPWGTDSTFAANKNYVDAHAARTDNPHSVTASQVGALALADTSALHAQKFAVIDTALSKRVITESDPTATAKAQVVVTDTLNKWPRNGKMVVNGNVDSLNSTGRIYVSDDSITFTVSPSDVVDCALGNVFRGTIGRNDTLSLSNMVDGQIVSVAVTNAGTYTLAWSGVNWAGGTPPTLSATANKRDVFTFIRAGGIVYGSAVQDLR